MKTGILPKGAQLPGVQDIKFDEEKIKEQAKLKMDKKAMSYTNPIVIFNLNIEKSKRRHKIEQECQGPT